VPLRNPFPFVRLRARLAVSGLLILLALAGFGWAWATSTTPITAACADSPPAAMELSIGSGVMRDGKESRIEVHAHPDGCVAVHRPWFLRDAGDYEVRLSAQEQASLQASVAIEALRTIDQKNLAAQAKGTWKEASNDQVVFADPDADSVTLQWNDGGVAHRLVTRATLHDAATNGLEPVAAAIGALRALSTHAGTRVQAEAAP